MGVLVLAVGALGTATVPDKSIFWFFVLLATPILYVSVAMIRNRTTLIADKFRLIAKSGPINKRILLHTEGVQQFFTHHPGATTTNGTVAYRVYMMDADSVAHPVWSAFPSTMALHQVCHELQDFYGLEDLPVYGHPRDKRSAKGEQNRT